MDLQNMRLAAPENNASGSEPSPEKYVSCPGAALNLKQRCGGEQCRLQSAGFAL
jgi:hypothetical protein